MQKSTKRTKKVIQYQSCGCCKVGDTPVKPETEAGLIEWYEKWTKLNKKNQNNKGRISPSIRHTGTSQGQVLSQFWDAIHTVRHPDPMKNDEFRC